MMTAYDRSIKGGKPSVSKAEGRMAVSARHIHHFIVSCVDLKEAQRSIPELTADLFEGVRNGTHIVKGDSVSGLEIVPKEAE